MATKAMVDELTEVIKELKKIVKTQTKQLESYSAAIEKLKQEVVFKESMVKEMKNLAEKSGSEMSVFKFENAKLKEENEHLKNEMVIING